ncbi:MAG: hypothetical protein N3E39_02915 [Candidatus Methanomethylicia archaeon]|nr:hypothetical protein [Candidatus Methanomethylicia archaeon]
MNEDNTKVVEIVFDEKRIAILIIFIIALGTLFLTYFNSLLAFIAPEQGLPLRITKWSTTDHVGTPKNIFKRGEMVLVNATIEMATAYYYYYYYYYYYVRPTRYLLIVEILYGDTPVFIGFVFHEIPPGASSTSGVGWSIPSNAPIGTYTVKIYVWSTWIVKGGVVLADNSGLSFTFRIEG